MKPKQDTWLKYIRKEAGSLSKMEVDIKKLHHILHQTADDLEVVYGPGYKPNELNNLRNEVKRLTAVNYRLTGYLESARWWKGPWSVGFERWFKRWQPDMSGFLDMEKKRKESRG